VEIGPGLGALTRPLLEATGKLDVVEIDRDVIPHLQSQCAGTGELRVHNVDVLKFDFSVLSDQLDAPLRLVGNLPYNISTPLLFHALDHAARVRDMHFMVQKEVAERMAAAPDSDDYGRLSVMVQWRCRVELLFIVGPGAFKPAPKVDSAVVRLTPHATPPVTVTDEKLFADMVNRAFTQRRKTLRNGLKHYLTADQINAAGIDPGLRPEVLTLEQFAALANAAARSTHSTHNDD
jgi:16S rRNA (adenine1518-N6/adenine1519-N6)-dimethyltransferase